MRHPTLRQVEGDLSRVAALAPKLAEAARWAWPMAYARLRGSGGEEVAAEARPVEAAVGSEGTPQWVIRYNVGRAGVLIGRAFEALVEAAACLRRAQVAAEARAPATTEAEGPPLVSKVELVRARAAQARRNAARPPGVGYGEF